MAATDQIGEGLAAADRRISSAPTSPPDNDDLLSEILLRLPPHHSSLPRAALVCRRWRRLVSHPAFLRRFRARTPPLIGFFIDDYGDPVFTPTPGHRIPSARFSLPQRPGECWSLLGCRHGLALLLDRTRQEALVWDPVTGLQRRVPYPEEFKAVGGEEDLVCNGTVVCAAGDGCVHGGDCYLSHFKLALVSVNSDCTRAFTCLYESKSGAWGSISSTAINNYTFGYARPSTSVMVGNALCWLLCPGRSTILEFDLSSQSLAVIEQPETHLPGHGILCTVNAELGLVILSKLIIQLWARKINSDGHGTVKWVLQKTIELDKLLSLRPAVERWRPVLLGFDEDNNMLFLLTAIGVFMIQLESLQFKKLFESSFITTYFPYTSFYSAGREIGGGDNRAELLNDCPVRSTKVLAEKAQSHLPALPR
ncbi:hypothetical protein ACP70R_015206 [Stipagrostis hirtigluma subsp. patula]